MRPEEFKTLILSLNQPLYRFARSLLISSQDAEDCVQEIFLKMWLKRESLSDVKNLKAFAMRMTRNLCLDKLKTKRHIMVEIENQIIESEINPLRELEAADVMVRMERIVSLLPEQQRMVIHLRSVEGLETDEIAEVTDMTVEHVRVTLSRARIAIRKLYDKYYEQH